MADLPDTRWGGASAFGNCCSGGGVFAGGYVGENISFTAIAWDLGTNTWNSMPNMLGERARMGGAVLSRTFYVVGGRSNASPSFAGTNDNQKLSCAVTLVSISGNVTGCASPAPVNLVGATMSLTGPSPAPSSAPTDGSGNYTLSGLTAGGTYTVTPTKTAHIPGSAGISTVDVIAVQRHFLTIGTPLSGCRLLAADVNGVGGINTVDVIAVQRFFLGLSTGIANTGKYAFTPTSTTYTSISGNQTAQNYSAVLFGDVATPFVPRPGGSSGDAASGDTQGYREVTSTVASVALPRSHLRSRIAAVTTSTIDAASHSRRIPGRLHFRRESDQFRGRTSPEGRTHQRQLERGWERDGWTGTNPDAARVGLLERLQAVERNRNVVRVEGKHSGQGSREFSIDVGCCRGRQLHLHRCRSEYTAAW